MNFKVNVWIGVYIMCVHILFSTTFWLTRFSDSCIHTHIIYNHIWVYLCLWIYVYVCQMYAYICKTYGLISMCHKCITKQKIKLKKSDETIHKHKSMYINNKNEVMSKHYMVLIKLLKSCEINAFKNVCIITLCQNIHIRSE